MEIKAVEGYALSKGKEVQFCLCLVSACLKIRYVAAARKVSSHWILKTIDFNRHYCFSIVWGLGSQPIALGSYGSCHMTLKIG